MTAGEAGTVRALVDEMARRLDGNIFLRAAETPQELSFADVRARADSMAGSLTRLGTAPGEPVAFLLENGLFTAEVLLGAMYAGRVAVPLNPSAGETALAHVLAHCEAQVVFVADEHMELCRAALRLAGRAARLVRADATSGFSEAGTEAGTDTEVSAVPALTADGTASLYYTSGTTGLPKGVLLTHGGLLAGARGLARAHQLTPRDRSFCVLPLYHLNALVSTLLPALVSGGSMVVPRRFNPTSFWDDAARCECTWSGLVPTLVSRLLLSHANPEVPAASGAPRMRFARCSSAPLETSQQRAFEERFGVPLIEAMGTTEAGATIFAQPLPPAPRKPGSVGIPVGFDIRIEDPGGRELPAGTAGEILVRSASVMVGYHRDVAGTAAVLDADGWLRTGDSGHRDDDGHFFITGRLKEIIVKAGEKVAPREVELALESHPAVQEAAAVGVPDPQLGQDIVAYVVLRPGALVPERELQSLCTSRIGAFKTPTEIHIVAELPRGPSGKLQRLRLAGRVPPPPSYVLPAASVERTIATAWTEVLGVEPASEDDDFFALGGQSLLAARLIARLREQLGVDLPLSAIFEAPTVSRLTHRILRQ